MMNSCITATVGGSFYMVNYALKPTKNRADTALKFKQVCRHYPEVKPWMDSLRQHHAITDTFLYSTMVEVGEDDDEIQVDAHMHRITSLCRVVFTDAIPDQVTQMHFEYTGGSGAFDAATGLGSVKSTQKVDFEVEPGQENCTFDLYTILHDTEGTLQLRAEAKDANQNVVQQRDFEVPMKQRVITKLTGPYFSAPSGSTITIIIGINTDWDGEQTIEF
jgi:hypothetical protein